MDSKIKERVPNAPIDKFKRPFLRFMQIEASGGFVLLICTAIALFFASSEWSHFYESFWHTPVANAGGDLDFAAVTHPLAASVAVGLLFRSCSQ